MKLINLPMLLGVMICGSIAARAPAHAQATTAPVVVEGDDKPWNRGVPIASRQAARELFLEGNRLFKVPLFARAAEQYAAALSKWKHPAFYFNLALAQLNLGQDVEARDSLEQALKHGEEPLGPDQFKEAQKQLHDVESQLGRIRISCETSGAEVTLDGVLLFTSPGRFQGWTKAKAHEITAKKQGFLSEARRVTVSPGISQDIDLKLVTLSEAADTGRRWAAWKPWLVVAGGATIAAAGGVLHALSARNFNAYDDKFQQLPCAAMPDPMFPGCAAKDIPSTLSDQLNRARREQTLAVSGYIAGGIVLASGAILVFLNRPHLAEQGNANTSARIVAVVPTISSDTLGLMVSVIQ